MKKIFNIFPQGVYVIENKITHMLYVGRTSAKEKNRWRIHRSELRSNNHFNKHLQSSWNKHGEDNFEFYMIDDRPEEEGFYIEYFRYLGIGLYNKTIGDSSNGGQIHGLSSGLRRGTRTGARLSDETKARISRAHKGKKSSPEQVRKIAEANSKTYPGFISPDGVIYRNIKGLRPFCREHGLSEGTMNRVANGYRKHYKGWRRIEEGM